MQIAIITTIIISILIYIGITNLHFKYWIQHRFLSNKIKCKYIIYTTYNEFLQEYEKHYNWNYFKSPLIGNTNGDYMSIHVIRIEDIIYILNYSDYKRYLQFLKLECKI